MLGKVGSGTGDTDIDDGGNTPLNTRKIRNVVWNKTGNILAAVENIGSKWRLCLFSFDFQTLTFKERTRLLEGFEGEILNVYFAPNGRYLAVITRGGKEAPLVFNIDYWNNIYQVKLVPELPAPESPDDIDYLNGINSISFSSDNQYLVYSVYGNSQPVAPRVFLYKYSESEDKFIRVTTMDSIYRSYGSLITHDAKFILSATDQTAIFKNNLDGTVTETWRRDNSDVSVVQECYELPNGLFVQGCDSQIVTHNIDENGLVQNRIVHAVESGTGRQLSYSLDNTAISMDYTGTLYKTDFELDSFTNIPIGKLAGIDYFAPPSLNPVNTDLVAVQSTDQANLFNLYSIANNELSKLNPVIEQIG